MKALPLRLTSQEIESEARATFAQIIGAHPTASPQGWELEIRTEAETVRVRLLVHYSLMNASREVMTKSHAVALT